MIFVDTGVWFAYFVAEDPDHTECRNLIMQSVGQLLTTDYVLDELFTLFRARGYQDVAAEVGSGLLDGQVCDLHWMTPDDFGAAWAVYDGFDDKQWSFTDCTSYAVMKALGIGEALSLDEHFHQFGFAVVRP